jgi:hypothetical protein
MATVIIEKQIDELTVERFEFYHTENKLYLDKYLLKKRENTRMRNYRLKLKYDRLNVRDSSLEESEVPFTEEIKAEAIKQFVDSIKCLKWSERYQ